MTSAPPRRVDGSMSLLVDMMSNPLDEGYAERAARAPEERRSQRWSALLALVAIGVVTGVAIDQVRQRQEAGTGLRAELAAEVRDRTAETERLSAQAEQLRADVAAARAAALGADAAGRLTAERLEALGLASGTVPVRGPGLVVTLSDAPEGEAEADESLRGGAPGDGRVQDRDLQDLVNGLWAGGAEAVSVNDVRLTALTAIRSAGDAVLVDFRLLSPPYVVRAVGDPGGLELSLLDGPVGRRLTTYVQLYGLTFEVRQDDTLSLPGAGVPDLRAALSEEERP